MGLTYEKGDSEIFMSGYKFAAAKLTACSALGCLAKYVNEPEELGKVCLLSQKNPCLFCILWRTHKTCPHSISSAASP